jgi:predicted AAA+ superfamily ATPase
MNIEEYAVLYASLALFGGVHTCALGTALDEVFEAVLREDEPVDILRSTAAFAKELYALGGDFGLALHKIVLDDTNLLVCDYGQFAGNHEIALQLRDELTSLEKISRLQPEDFAPAVGEYSGMLPRWKTTWQNFSVDYPTFLLEIPQKGFGKFAKYTMFRASAGNLEPVRFPDPQKLTDLLDYQQNVQSKLIANTQDLVQGLPAAHALLYGDAGTGKSSLVKSLCNAFSDDGLRLIEVPRSEIPRLPELIEEISSNPLRFILFLDDIAFDKPDEVFTVLKSVLEGGAQSPNALGRNYCIYATSNRRHMLRESTVTRLGDEIHISDALQERVSLYDRFGLTLRFARPDKAQFQLLTAHIARQAGLEMDADKLFAMAETEALRRGGRSPRLVKQLVRSLQNIH